MKKTVAAFRGMHVSPANIAMRDYQESVTTGQTHGRTGCPTDRRTHRRRTKWSLIPMCRYASQVTQTYCLTNSTCEEPALNAFNQFYHIQVTCKRDVTLTLANPQRKICCISGTRHRRISTSVLNTEAWLAMMGTRSFASNFSANSFVFKVNVNFF